MTTPRQRRTALHGDAQRRTATHSSDAQRRTATHSDAQRRAATHSDAQQRTATPCDLRGCLAAHLTPLCSLLLDGDIHLHSLALDGALAIHACAGARVHVRECTVSNRGWALEAVEPGSEPKGVSIRGYRVGDRSTGSVITVETPGEFELRGNGELVRLA